MTRNRAIFLITGTLVLSFVYVFGVWAGDSNTLLVIKCIGAAIWLAALPVFGKLLQAGIEANVSNVFLYFFDALFVGMFFTLTTYRSDAALDQLTIGAVSFVAVFYAFSFLTKKRLV